MNKLIILTILILSGCVCTEESYPEKTIYLKYNSKYNIDVLAAQHSFVKKNDTILISNIIFNKVRGGRTLLFGKLIKDTGNGFKENRLFLTENKNLKKSYSINVILTFKTEKIDTMTVYIVPD